MLYTNSPASNVVTSSPDVWENNKNEYKFLSRESKGEGVVLETIQPIYTFTHKQLGNVTKFMKPYSIYRSKDQSTDICAYCGQDNGKHSENRVGYDCGWCGSN